MQPQTSQPDASAPIKSWQQQGRQLLASTRLRRGVFVLLGLLLLFGLLGYLWLPGYLQGKLETELSELLQRPAHIGQVEVRPYDLSVSVTDLRIAHRDGEQPVGRPGNSAASSATTTPLAGFARLELDVSSASLWRRALVLEHLHLEGPYVHLQRHADGRTNVSDLVEKFAAPAAAEAAPPAFAINNLSISAGQLTLDDQLSGSRHDISDVELVLPRLASLAAETELHAQPRFSARLDGAPINIAGAVRPFTDTPDGRLALKFAGLDLARLAAFSPLPLPLQLNSARLDGELNLDFDVAEAHQIALSGQLALHQLKARQGALTLGLERAQVILDAADLLRGPLELRDLKLQSLALHRHEDFKDGDVGQGGDDKAAPAQEPFLALVELQLDQLKLHVAARQVVLGQLSLQGLRLALARTGETQLDVLEMLAELQTEPARPSTPAVATPAQKAAAAALPAWRWQLAGVGLEQGRLYFVDRTVSKALPLTLEPLRLSLGSLDSTAPAPLQFSLASRINEKGRLALEGQVDLHSGAGAVEVDLEQMDLVPLQGWIPRHLNLVLTGGVLSTQGKLKFDGEPLRLQFLGKGQVGDLALMEADADRSLLRWKQLALSGLEVHTAPFSLKLEDVALTRFFARLLVTPTGELHLDRLLRGEAGTTAATAASAVPAPTSAAAAAPPLLLAEAAAVPTAQRPPESVQTQKLHPASASAPPLPLYLGRIRLEGGTVIFNDQFIKPNYTANLSQLSGEIGPLATGQRGKLNIQGKVDRTAPLAITGELEPFNSDLFLNLRAQARGIDMPGFSPYSGRYIGYRIQKGKLSVDVHYQVEGGQLQASNRIFLDQLTLGEKVESPDALSLPINLALALLKNSRGEIDVELPISGSINDPEFSIGGIVFKAIMNLLLKAVTSPFTLLGSLFGGGEELSHVDFAPGLATLAPDMEKRLQQLGKALTDRPGLSLEVTGMADAAADVEAYRRYLLERQVRARKVAAEAAQGKSAASLGQVRLTPEEYEKYLGQIYKEARFDKPKNMIGLAKGLPLADMEKLLLAHLQVEEEGLRDLARRRAQSVQRWLVEQGSIAPERVFVLEPEVALPESSQPQTGNPAHRVQFSLR